MTATDTFDASAVPHERARTRAPAPAALRAWLWTVAALVFAMVLVGGATRLTDSGLSITEWAPVTGTVPPLSAEAWEVEFDKYRQIPEYQRINKGMSLSEFQFIYWWEWGHRFLGRLIGLAFFVPMVVFWARGDVPGWLKPRLVGLFFLGGLQGAVGWYMVASGLVDRVDVSQYRLALHLTLAAIIFLALVWTAWGARPLPEGLPRPSGALAWGGLGLAGFVLLQIYLGALVAGLDAGLTYTTWPLMDGRFIPDAAKLFAMTPAWANLFENVLTVQFVHRMTAYGLLAAAIAFGVWQWRAKAGGLGLLIALGVTLQALVGIATLVQQVPLDWALAHQGGAFLLLALATVNAQALRRGRTGV